MHLRVLPRLHAKYVLLHTPRVLNSGGGWNFIKDGGYVRLDYRLNRHLIGALDELSQISNDVVCVG